MPTRILVVGGGLAGLVLAIGLGRRGLECDVVEREPTWAPVGAGIGLLPNAMRCLDHLGVGDAVRAATSIAPSGSATNVACDCHCRSKWSGIVARTVTGRSGSKPVIRMRTGSSISAAAGSTTIRGWAVDVGRIALLGPDPEQ
jgi:hypothetical protein